MFSGQAVSQALHDRQVERREGEESNMRIGLKLSGHAASQSPQVVQRPGSCAIARKSAEQGK